MPVVLLVVAAWIALAAIPGSHGILAFALMWGVMAIAMMIPTVMRPLQRAAAGSAVRALHFVCGFVCVWLVVGVPAYLVMNAIVWTPAWVALAWMGAGAYQLTRGCCATWRPATRCSSTADRWRTACVKGSAASPRAGP